MEPELLAFEFYLYTLETQLQSLCHGLNVVQQELQDLAELPGHWRDDEQGA